MMEKEKGEKSDLNDVTEVAEWQNRDNKNQPDGRKGGQEEENRPINSLFYWRCRTETKRTVGPISRSVRKKDMFRDAYRLFLDHYVFKE